MKVTRKSIITGIERTKDIDIDLEKLTLWEEGKVLIQDIAGHLSPNDREFIMMGIVQEEWDQYVIDEINSFRNIY